MFSIYQLLPALASAIPPALISALIYAGLSYGIFVLAQKCGLKRPFLAWIPFARFFVLGQLADRYLAKKGKTSKFRIILPVAAVSVEVISLLATLVIRAASNLLLFLYTVCIVLIYAFLATGVLAILSLLLLFVLFLIITVYNVIYNVISAITVVTSLVFYGLYVWVLHYAYKQCNQEYATLFTVLSVLFNFAPPIILPILAHKYRSEEKKASDEALAAEIPVAPSPIAL